MACYVCMAWHHVLAALHFVLTWSEMDKNGQQDLSHIKISNKFNEILLDKSNFLVFFTSDIYFQYSFIAVCRKTTKRKALVFPQMCQEGWPKNTWFYVLGISFHAKPASWSKAPSIWCNQLLNNLQIILLNNIILFIKKVYEKQSNSQR